MRRLHHRAKAPNNVVATARAMRQRGATYEKIANVLQVPYFTIRDWVTYRTRPLA